ncbi:MAG: dTDP-4-dehydrorhamnose reductase [Nitrospiraceae bacterium]|nr:dTDP-4-dehydrorhamnose reductase [Nitrospiraceae bacterium]
MSLKVALTGPTGQLGSDIRRSAPPEIELVTIARGEMDIGLQERVEAVITGLRPDFIINTAAYVRVDDAEDEAGEAFRVNALGARNLALAAEKTGAALIHISTDYVFDGFDWDKNGKVKNKNKNKNVPYNEDDIANPLNTYGISKYAGELFVRNFSSRHYIVRLAGLYGRAGASGKGGNFVYTVLDRARRGEPLRVVDDIFMSPTYAADAAGAIWDLIMKVKPFGLYHAANGGVCSWYEFAVSILRHAGIGARVSPISHTDYKTRARRPLWSPLESSRGVRPRHWEEALGDFIASLE